MKSRIVGLALIIAVALITGCATSEEPVEEFDITQEVGAHQEEIIVNAQEILDDFQSNELRAEKVYRDVYYGMSKVDVIEAEGRVPDTDEETLITYIETIDGKSVKLYYGFDDKSELQSIFVYSNGQHEDARLFIQDYEEIDEYLTETYGEPDVSRLNWLDLARRDKPDEYIIAVLYGELEYLSTGDKGSYVVQHKLSGENGSTLTDMYAILPKE